MRISPRRRQRALKAHELRQQGRSLRHIGKQLDISHTTVLADLKLIETQWSEFAQQSADDFLLEQFGLLQNRLRAILRRDLFKVLSHFKPADFTRLYAFHVDELATLLRETRRLTDQLQERAELRQLESDQLDQELGFPLEELTADPKPAQSAKSAKSAPKRKPAEATNAHHGLPKPSKPNHPNHSKPRKTLEIPRPTLQEKKSNQPPTKLTPEKLQREAETFLRNYNRHPGQELQPAAAG